LALLGWRASLDEQLMGGGGELAAVHFQTDAPPVTLAQLD
jgi:hypothetical protein